MNFDLDKLISPVFHPFIGDHSRHRISVGGRGSGKSYHIATEQILRMLTLPKCSMLCVRACYEHHSFSTFPLFQDVILRLGLTKHFKITTRPCFITCLSNQYKNDIVFVGANKPEANKSATARNGPFRVLWVEEADQLGEDSFDTIDYGIRGLDWNQAILTLNTGVPNWVKKRADTFDPENPDKTPDLRVVYSSYLDNPHIGEQTIRMFENLKINNPDRYKIIGLGQWGSDSGKIFNNLKIHSFPTEPYRYTRVFAGADFGFEIDPTVIMLMAEKDGEVYVLREMVFKRELPSNSAKLINEAGHWKGVPICGDSAAPVSIEEWRLAGLSVFGCSKVPPKGSTTNYTTHALRVVQNIKKIHIHEGNCPYTAQTMGLLSPLKIRDVVVEGRTHGEDHAFDAFKYGYQLAGQEAVAPSSESKSPERLQAPIM